MRLILTIAFILTTLCSIASGLDSTQIMVLNKNKNQEINLHLRSYDKELSTNGFLTSVSGLGFTTIGILLEQKRIQQNIGAFFYYARAVDESMLSALNKIEPH